MRFARKAIVGLALFTGALAIGNYSIESAELYRWPAVNEFAPTRAKPFGYWIARDFQNTVPAPDIVVFGDSQLGGLRSADAKFAQANLDFALDHRSYALESILNNDVDKFKTFVISQPGALLSDYLAIAESLLSDTKKPDRVILAVTPRVFLSNGLPFPGHSEYYRYFSANVALGSIYDLAFPTVESKMHAVFQSMSRSHLSTVAPGQFVFIPDDPQRFNDKIEMYPANFSYDGKDCEQQMQFLDKMLKFLNDQNIVASVVSMPMMNTGAVSEFRKLQPDLASRIRASCKKYDAEYWDLTDDEDFSREDFLDPIHLSQAGGEKFAITLTARLKGAMETEKPRSAAIND